MAIIVEDGTGLANAVSYVSVTDADSYFTVRGVTEWGTLATPAKEAALIRATDYIEMRWGDQFRGTKTNPTVQALSFPRLLWTGLPVPLVRACLEYALRAATDTLIPANGYSEDQVTKKVEKVGPIQEETTFLNRGRNSTMLSFQPIPAADTWIRYLLNTGTGVVR